MNNPVYIGPFKDHIQNYVGLKQAVGYRYNNEAKHLKRFDKFTYAKYPESTVLSKEIILDWCGKKTYEAQGTQRSRTSILRQFGKYLDSIEVKAYIIPKRYYPKEQQYMPYIYTVDELEKFFAETEKCQYHCGYPSRHLIMPVIFLMIYMCGLRLSEARLLKVGDVDLEEGILSIQHSKKDNSRLVSMSDSLIARCRNYSKKVHPYPIAENYYFPARDAKPMTEGNLYKNFRKFLWHAGISHRGKGCGPRIHDFRHTYAVHCLKKWSLEEKDLSVYLPILKIYMGHDSFKETAYYLRLTADVFPNILLKTEALYLGIIPKLEGDTNETY